MYIFANDIVLVDEACSGVSEMLEVGDIQILKFKGFRLSTIKTEYLECKFSFVNQAANVEVKIDILAILKIHSFKYLGSII